MMPCMFVPILPAISLVEGLAISAGGADESAHRRAHRWPAMRRYRRPRSHPRWNRGYCHRSLAPAGWRKIRPMPTTEPTMSAPLPIETDQSEDDRRIGFQPQSGEWSCCDDFRSMVTSAFRKRMDLYEDTGEATGEEWRCGAGNPLWQQELDQSERNRIRAAAMLVREVGGDHDGRSVVRVVEHDGAIAGDPAVVPIEAEELHDAEPVLHRASVRHRDDLHARRLCFRREERAGRQQLGPDAQIVEIGDHRTRGPADIGIRFGDIGHRFVADWREV